MDRRAALQALKAGIAGTVVLSFLLLFIEAQTRSRVRAGEVIGQYIGITGDPLLATGAFVLVTAVLWPLAFIALESRDLLPGRNRLRRLLLFAFALAIAFVITGYGGLSGPVLILYAVGVVVAHVAYGFTLNRVLRPIEPSTDA